MEDEHPEPPQDRQQPPGPGAGQERPDIASDPDEIEDNWCACADPDADCEEQWFEAHLGEDSCIVDDTNGEYTSMLLEERRATRGRKRARMEEAEEADDDDGENGAPEEAEEEAEADRERSVGNMNLDEAVVSPSSPSLMGMPDIVLEGILQYTCKHPSEACDLETVCKRFRRVLVGEDYWDRHPLFKKEQQTTYCLLDPAITNGRHWRYNRALRILNLGRLPPDEERLLDRVLNTGAQLAEKLGVLSNRLESGYRAVEMTTRDKAFLSQFQKRVEEYQWKDENEEGANEILAVLGVDDFRTLAADILSRMMPFGSITGEVNLRVRGDTVGYLAEVLQGHLLSKLSLALTAAMNSDRYEVRTADIKLCTRRNNWRFQPLGQPLQPWPFHCDVSANEHGQESTLGCTCSLPQTSGRIWIWPDNNCHDALPSDAGRRIIRRLAFKAGIAKLTNEAFQLAEAELLHAMGILLVEACEASFVASQEQAASPLGPDQSISYNHIGGAVDMFQVPPPPIVVNHIKTFDFEKEEYDAIQRRNEQEGYSYDTLPDEPDAHYKSELLYTVVPGQIRSAAEKRGIYPHMVYGDTWIPSPGFTVEEEKETEESYYYQPIDKKFEPYYPDDQIRLFGVQTATEGSDDESDEEMILIREESESSSSEEDDCSSAGYHTESSVESEDKEIMDADFWDDGY